jgi:hypothetical protein
MMSRMDRLLAIARAKREYLLSLDAAGPVFPLDNPKISKGAEHITWHIDLNDFWARPWHMDDYTYSQIPIFRPERSTHRVWYFSNEISAKALKWTIQEWKQIMRATNGMRWHKVGRGRSACYRQLHGTVCEVHRWEARLEARHVNAEQTCEDEEMGQRKCETSQTDEKGQLVGRLQCWNADYEYNWDKREWQFEEGTVCVLEVRGGVSDPSISNRPPREKLHSGMYSLSPELGSHMHVKIIASCIQRYIQKQKVYRDMDYREMVYLDSTLREIFQHRATLPYSSLQAGLKYSPHTHIVYTPNEDDDDDDDEEESAYYTENDEVVDEESTFPGGVAVVGGPMDHALGELSRLKFDHSHGENQWILNFDPDTGGIDDARTIVREMRKYILRVLSEQSRPRN